MMISLLLSTAVFAAPESDTGFANEVLLISAAQNSQRSEKTIIQDIRKW